MVISKKKAVKKTRYGFYDVSGVAKSLPKMIEALSGNLAVNKQILYWCPVVKKHGSVSFEFEKETSQKYFEQGGSIQSKIEYTYDKYSNVVKETKTTGNIVFSKMRRTT